MLEKDGALVSIRRTLDDQEFPYYWNPEGAGETLIQLIVTRSRQSFYPVVVITSEFKWENPFNTLHIQVRHNRDKHDLLVDPKKSKISKDLYLNLGSSSVNFTNSPDALSLRHVLCTAVCLIVTAVCISRLVAKIDRTPTHGVVRVNNNAQAGRM